MKYFFDTEFITGFKKSVPFLPTIGKWNKPEFFIQLISIGIVADDGSEYYAISNEFNPRVADSWVIINVLEPIYNIYEEKAYNLGKHIPGLWYNYKDYTHKRLMRKLKHRGKSNSTIRREIVEFMKGGIDDMTPSFWVPKETEVYAYYADYDWVVFCSLFGRMIDLPAGMPMYCRDLKQMLDEIAENMSGFSEYATLEHRLWRIKKDRNFPKQEKEHNALDDARWNKKLYEFLKSI